MKFIEVNIPCEKEVKYANGSSSTTTAVDVVKINVDAIAYLRAEPRSKYTRIALKDGSSVDVDMTMDELSAMIEEAEWNFGF